MKKLISIAKYLIVAILIGVTVTYAGSLTSPGTPAKTMKSLSNLYELINTGSNTPSTDFTTPDIVSATMNSLGDIYDLMTTKIAAIDATKILTGTTIFGVAGSASVADVSAALLKTNQTICYNTAGAVVSCSLTGQDGEILKGVARSYTDNSDGTITDNATGLVWQKCSQGLSGSTCTTGTATSGTWANALSYCNANTAGLPGTSWRLPNVHEIYSIVDLSAVSAPFINLTYFPATQDSYYWSSTSFPTIFSFAMFGDFLLGVVGSDSKTGSLYTRCVRG